MSSSTRVMHAACPVLTKYYRYIISMGTRLENQSALSSNRDLFRYRPRTTYSDVSMTLSVRAYDINFGNSVYSSSWHHFGLDKLCRVTVSGRTSPVSGASTGIGTSMTCKQRVFQLFMRRSFVTFSCSES